MDRRSPYCWIKLVPLCPSDITTVQLKDTLRISVLPFSFLPCGCSWSDSTYTSSSQAASWMPQHLSMSGWLMNTCIPQNSIQGESPSSMLSFGNQKPVLCHPKLHCCISCISTMRRALLPFAMTCSHETNSVLPPRAEDILQHTQTAVLGASNFMEYFYRWNRK